jgi:hypothetical protein
MGQQHIRFLSGANRNFVWRDNSGRICVRFYDLAEGLMKGMVRYRTLEMEMMNALRRTHQIQPTVWQRALSASPLV